MFPGVGDEYVGAGLELYREEPVFAEELDRCAERLAPILGFDIRSLLYPEAADGDRTAAGGAPDLKKMLGRVGEDESELALHRPAAAHPICFSLEYALARLLHAWGVEPVAMVGHSMGEYVAACVAGVLSIDDALEIVGRRAALIADLPEGAMVAVPLAEADVEPFVGNGVSLAAVNAPEVSVLAGDSEAIDAVESRLRDRDVVAQRVRTSHAFHSRVMEEVRGSLEALFAGVELRPPRIPYVSNVSGTWITDEEATDPRYWGEHLCRPVRFADAVRRIRQRHRSPILVEVGPGQTLCSLAAAAAEDSEIECIHTIDPRYDRGSADASVLAAVGRLWTAGVSIDWAAVYDGQPRRRVAAPTYPFERRRYWIERPSRPRAVVPTPLPEPPRPQEPIAAPPAPVAFRNAHPRTLETPYAAPRTETERVLAEAWADLLGIEAVGVHDAFVELGGHSLLALQLANRLWEKHRLELPLATLFEHQTVAAVAAALDGEGGSSAAEEAPAAGEVEVDEPPGAFERLLHDQVARSIGRMPLRDERLRPGEVATVVPELLRVVRRDHGMPLYPNEILRHATVRGLAGYLEDEIARFGDLTGTAPSVPEPEPADEGVGGPAAFVLSSVRSGSTLLRVMLAGDPALFCPPELHLLGHRTMGERAGAEPSPDRDQGIRRALAELRGVDMDEAQAEIDATTHADLPTWEVVRRLADLAAPRLLVDKSPGYANDVRTLHRIERSFDEPRFVVLLRHPYAVVDSVVRNRFVRLMEGGEISPFDFGEFVWTRSYGNILDFVETLPPERYVLLRFEELVTRPREALEPVCSLLGIRFSDALLEPYEGRRMRDGLGDPNFLRHDRIDASLGEAWRRVRLPRPLGRAARELAEALGYEIPGAGRTASAAPAGTRGAAV
jgi:malonyl CoA-acyl carrier protein transacylase